MTNMTNTDERDDLGKVIASLRAKAEHMRLQGMYYAQERWGEFADRLAALQAPIAVTDAVARDAARYRWLREQHNGINGWHVRSTGLNIPEYLDDEIDAALAQPEGAQDGNVS